MSFLNIENRMKLEDLGIVNQRINIIKHIIISLIYYEGGLSRDIH